MKRLSAERRRFGWSRAELARRAGMNAGTVSLIETGRLLPYPSQLAKIAGALGISAEGLLDEVSDDGDAG